MNGIPAPEAVLPDGQNKQVPAVPQRLRDKLYDRIPFSVRAMDRIIVGLAAAIVSCLAMAILSR